MQYLLFIVYFYYTCKDEHFWNAPVLISESHVKNVLGMQVEGGGFIAIDETMGLLFNLAS